MVAPNQPRIKNNLAPLKPENFKGNRFAMYTLVVIFALGATLFLSNYSRKPRRNVPFKASSSPANRELLKGGMSGEAPRANIQDMGPQPVPRYLANMATKTGDYVVSVRQVIGNTGGQNLLAGNATPLAQVILSVQAVALTDEGEKALQGFSATLTAEDDTHARLNTVQTKAPVRFKRGLGQLFQLSAPNVNAKRLLSLNGEVTLKTDSGTDKRLAFQLKNVSLPYTSHYYGVASLGYLSDEEAKRFAQPQNPSDFPFINSPDIVFFKKPFPPYAPESNPIQLPSRVMLSPLFPNDFALYLPSDKAGGATKFLNCSLRIHSEKEGAIEGAMTVSLPGGEAKASRFQVWDGEAGLFLLPGFAPSGGKPLALRLQLFVHAFQDRYVMSDYIPSASFTLAAGQRGALVSGQMLAGKAPIPGGLVHLEITPRDTSLKPQTVSLYFSESGEWKLGNFAPGIYDFRVDFIDVRRSTLYSKFSSREYLRYRYGFKRVRIENQIQRGVNVRQGGVISLKPFRLVEGGTPNKKSSLPGIPEAEKPLSISRFGFGRRASNVTPAN